jgi:hypothetical protein
MVRRPVFSAVLGAVAGILILASGCADQGPTAVQLKPAKAISAGRAYQRGAFIMNVGPLGGTFHFPIGHIVFPAGAVSDETVITASVDGKTLAVEFQPHLVFPDTAKPVLTFSFAGNSAAARDLVVYHVGDSGEILDQVTPSVDVENSDASVSVGGFSAWILGAGRGDD